MSRLDDWASAAEASARSAAARERRGMVHCAMLRCTVVNSRKGPRRMSDADYPIRIRKIGHVGIYCRDLPKMVDFYTRVLGFKVSDVNEKGMTFLRFGADHHSFVLAPAPQAPGGPTVLQQIAMEVADLDTLKRIRAYLLEQSVKASAIKHEGPGNDYTFDFDDPEGNRLQFFCEMDQIGWDGKSRPKEQWKRFSVED